MRQSVLNAFKFFSEPLEGRVHWMYLDILGLVTAGCGNLADPIGLALKMPWRSPSGEQATTEEVRRDWAALKAMQELKKLHYKYAAKVTKVRLTDEGIDQMVRDRLEGNERVLKKTFPAWDEWPADAQLGVCSMAWAVGAGFPVKFGNFTRFAKKQKWLEAMASCKIREEDNPGIVPRNRANRLCFANAATALSEGMDPEVLHWPNEAISVPTDPAIPVEAIITPFSPDPNIEAVHEQRDADLSEEQEDTHPETPEAKS